MDPSPFAGTSRFRIGKLLGRGGMGVVYEAVDSEQNVRVALKTLRDDDPQALLRFKQEFRTVQDVAHPNLVRLGELIEHHGRWFFTMELVEGTNLLAHVRTAQEPAPVDDLAERPTATVAPAAPPPVAMESTPELFEQTTAAVVRATKDLGSDPEPLAHGGPRRFDEARLRDAFSQLAEGIASLHRAGLVHRDVKPSNVVVTAEGRVVLLDFGIASEVASVDDPQLLNMGTLSFMSPEQLDGVAPEPPSDCYAIGVTLYLALTGTVPYRARTRELLRWTREHAPLRPPHDLCPDVPADLDALAMALLQPDPAARPTAEEIARILRQPTAPTGAAPWARREATVPSFLGRAAELRALEAARADSRSGGTVAVLITGDSGIGKSALVRRFRRDVEAAQPDALILRGRCHERESVPYKAADGVIDALCQQLGRLEESAALPALPEGIDALCQVFPVLNQVAAIASRASAVPLGDRPDARRSAFGALRELLVWLGRRSSLVVLIDDLQWADADSMILLDEVLRPPGPPLLLVATLRGPADTAVPLTSVELRRIHLEPLGADEARELAHRCLGEAGAAMAASVAREAAGHPLFITELAQHVVDGAAQSVASDAEPVGPTELSLDEALRQRMSRLDDPTRDVLELVALAGAPLRQSVLAQIAGVSYAELAGRVAALRGGRLLRTSGARPGDHAEPYHDRISEALRAAMPAEVARAWHGRLARGLEPLPESSPELLSEHFAGAGEPARAAEHAVRAAREAAAALAFARAARLYRRALALQATVGADVDVAHVLRLEVALGEALVSAGQTRDAAEVFARAATRASPPESLDLRRRSGESYLVSGQVDRGVETLSGVMAELGMSLPRSRDRMLLSIGVARARIALRGRRYRVRPDVEVDPEVRLKLDIAWAANMGLAFVDVLQSTWFQHQYILLAFRTGERRHLVRALVAEAGVSAAVGAKAAARTARIVAELDTLDTTLAPYERGLIGTIRVLVANFEGRHAEAVPLARATLRFLEQAGYSSSWDMGTLRMMLLWNLFVTGQTREMVVRSDETRRAARDRGDMSESTLLRTGVQNHVWLVRGESAAARRAAIDAAAGWSKRGTLVHSYLDVIAQCAIDIYEDPESDRAYQRVAAAWPGFRRELLLAFENGRVNGHDARGRATVAAAVGAPPSRQKELLRAAEKDVAVLARQSQAPAWPLADTIRAAILHQRSDDARAVTALRAAAAGYDAAQMAMHGNAVRRRLGVLLGGDEGRALVVVADAAMRAEAIADPERMTALLAPGFRGGR
jgi:serine/threonine protein kinase